MGIYFKGTEEVSATFEGNKQTKKMLGNMEPKENVGEHGTQENKFSIFGEQASLFQPPPPLPP